MKSWTFKLEWEGSGEVYNPAVADIEMVLNGIHPRRRFFFILSDSTGDYVQVAGARSRLIMEYRRTNPEGFQHFVLGRQGEARSRDSTNLTSVNYSGGAITLKPNQVLTIKDAIKVFVSFSLNHKIPGEYALEDVTQRFP